jgi:hypothetical protein
MVKISGTSHNLPCPIMTKTGINASQLRVVAVEDGRSYTWKKAINGHDLSLVGAWGWG